MITDENGHKWVKQNLVALKDRRGLYDLYFCEMCSTKYKRRTLDFLPPFKPCKRKL